MNDAELDAWYAGLSDDARSHVETSATVSIALLFSEQARARALLADAALDEAIIDRERAQSYLRRTTATLEMAIRLHSMGR